MDIPKEKLRDLEGFFKYIPYDTRRWYRIYWNNMTPSTNRERWQRWIFAAASIHTGWENNVAQYNALKNIKGEISVNEIANRIKTGGMQNRKATLIANISNLTSCWEKPEKGTDWLAWRDYHKDNLWGIGNAKISFAAELIDPLSTNIICIDRHILHAFGQDKEKAPKIDDYMEMEDIWLYLSNKADIPPAITRFIYWDCHIQEKTNSRYWSSLLEKNQNE